MSFRMLQADVLSWAKDKDLLYSQNADKQFMKFIEEVFEFKYEMQNSKDRKSTRLNSSHSAKSRMPSSA